MSVTFGWANAEDDCLLASLPPRLRDQLSLTGATPMRVAASQTPQRVPSPIILQPDTLYGLTIYVWNKTHFFAADFIK